MLTSTMSLILAELNEQQKQAVTAPIGPTVVFAGPGSGKTTVLTRRVLYLLEQGNQPEHMMVVTFTRAAAQEMKTRLLQIMPEKANRLAIGTFHSLFLKMLKADLPRIPAFLAPLEQSKWVRTWLEEHEQPADEETISTYLNQIGLCKSNLLFPQNMKVQKQKNKLFRDLYHAYEEKKRQLGYWDFDDILLVLYHRLQDEANLQKWQKRYSHILVDEFQDINKVQYDIVTRLAKQHQSLFVVGDDDQSIYGFRGSDPGYMFRLKQDFPSMKQIILSTNYRSTDEVIQISNQLICHNKQRQKKRLQGTASKGPPLHWLQPTDEETEAEQIIAYLDDGMKTAILYRTSTQARAVIDALVRKGIPFSVSNKEHSFYQRWQVQDLLAYIRIAYNPHDLDALVRIINKPKRYLYGKDWIDALWHIARRDQQELLDALPRLPNLEPFQIKLFQELKRQISKCREKDAVNGLRWICDEIGYGRYLEKFAEETGNDRLLLWEPVEELLLAAKHCSDGQALLKHVEKVEQHLKKQHTHPQVFCMTFHKAKGLEFERVFLIGLHAMFLPHRRSLQVSERRRAAAWEEERRLFYVAITRAQSELYFSVSQTRQGKKLGPSPFLKEIGDKQAFQEIAVAEEETMPVMIKTEARPYGSQSQLQFVAEKVSPGDQMRHIQFGMGEVVRISRLKGRTPGRKVLIRFADGLRTLHYELSRQLRLLHKN